MVKFRIKFGDGTEMIVEVENFSDAVKIAMKEGEKRETSVSVEGM